MQDQVKAGEEPQKKLEILASRNFTSWLYEQKCSLVFTTYQVGKIFFVGLQPDCKLSIYERTFPRAMGVCASEDTNTIYMSSLYQVWRFENALIKDQVTNDLFDRVYVPQMAYTTGDCDLHDMVVTPQGKVYFVNTLFGCVATLSEKYSFEPVWKPPFLTKLAAEDRCHLNGLALRDGEPRYASMVAQTDVVDGWREHRKDGGVVMDITNNKVVCEGLSMPHSPRYHNKKLWVSEAGSGYFGHVNLKTKSFEPMTFCQGFMRGCSFINNYAIVATSLQRENRTFSDLALDKNLADKNAEPRCAIYVIDINTGDIVHWLHIEGVVQELYDVVVLPNVIRPKVIGVKSSEIQHIISIPPTDESI